MSSCGHFVTITMLPNPDEELTLSTITLEQFNAHCNNSVRNEIAFVRAALAGRVMNPADGVQHRICLDVPASRLPAAGLEHRQRLIAGALQGVAKSFPFNRDVNLNIAPKSFNSLTPRHGSRFVVTSKVCRMCSITRAFV